MLKPSVIAMQDLLLLPLQLPEALLLPLLRPQVILPCWLNSAFCHEERFLSLDACLSHYRGFLHAVDLVLNLPGSDLLLRLHILEQLVVLNVTGSSK